MNRRGKEGSVIPTPAELARIIEAYDKEDWFEFLDQMDVVYRHRRERESEPDPPVNGGREPLADWVDRSIREIWFLPKGAPADEIRFIEVNDRMAGPDPRQGPIATMELGLGLDGCSFRLSVADVTSEELERIKAGHLTLPTGWTLDDNKIYHRRYS